MHHVRIVSWRSFITGFNCDASRVATKSLKARTIAMSSAETLFVAPKGAAGAGDCPLLDAWNPVLLLLDDFSASVGDKTAAELFPYFRIKSLFPTLLTNPSAFWRFISTGTVLIVRGGCGTALPGVYTVLLCGAGELFTWAFWLP